MSAAIGRFPISPFSPGAVQWKQKVLLDRLFPDYAPVSTQPVLPAKNASEDQEVFENLIGSLKENFVDDTTYTNPQISLQEKLQGLQNHPLLRSPIRQRVTNTPSHTDHKYRKNKVEILMLVDERSQTDSDTDSTSIDSPLPTLQSLASPQGSRISRKLHSSQSTPTSLPRRPTTSALPSLFRSAGAVSSVPVIQGFQCKQIVVNAPAVLPARPYRALPPV
eukprot:gene25339-30598_t